MLCILWRLELLSAISRYPMYVLLQNLMLAGQSINLVCMDFWSPYLVQMAAEIHVFIANVDSDLLVSWY